MNVKAMGVVLLGGLILSFLEVIFIPMIDANLVTLKASAPDVATNTTIDNTRKLLFLLPLGTIIASVGVSFGIGFLAK